MHASALRPPTSRFAATTGGRGRGSRGPRRVAPWCCGGAAWLSAGCAAAYTAVLTPAAPKAVYLQVGVGSFTANYDVGGQPQNNTTINDETVSVAATAVGNGAAQAMTTNSTQTKSYWDGFTYCTVPGQLYIGGFYRTTGAATAAAQVTASVPAVLTDATGDTISFATIAWTSSGIADTGAEPFPSATFIAGGLQNVGSMASNTWNESCWAFTYSNKTTPPAGTYTGRVTYTMSSP